MTDPAAAHLPAEPQRRLREVYLDSDVLTTIEPSPDRRGPGRRVLAPGAGGALATLGDLARLIAIADQPLADVPELAHLATLPAIPAEFPGGSWYITHDPSWCEGDRPAGLRSILVGPRRPPARRPTLRCDIEARDLGAAVMEILVRETMA